MDCAESLAPKPIRVGVYHEHRASASDKGCVDITLYLLNSQRGIEGKQITSDEILAGKLSDFDVLILPGGMPKKQLNRITEKGMDLIRNFVAGGGGYIGVCAGAEAAACPRENGWLGIAAVQALDERTKWGSGSGMADLSTTPEFARIVGNGREEITMSFVNGPLLEHAVSDPSLPPVQVLARFTDDLYSFDKRKRMAEASINEKESIRMSAQAIRDVEMKGKLAVIATRYGSGQVVLFSTHPELTSGQEELFLKTVLWAARLR